MNNVMILYFFLGSSLTSYFLCLYDRISHKEISSHRSVCEGCHRLLKWYELIPVLGYLLDQGTCPTCGYQIPVLYPILECLGGFLMILCFLIK